MTQYGDHPGRERLYVLALQRRPPGQTPPRPAVAAETTQTAEAPDDDEDIGATDSRSPLAAAARLDRALERRLAALTQRGDVTAALEQVQRVRSLGPPAHATALGIIARGYFRQG